MSLIDASFKLPYNQPMKKNIAVILLFVCVLVTGCSSGGSSKPMSVITAPAILSISPTSGGPGTMVTIQGNRFGLLQGNGIVSYAGVTYIPSTWSDTQITLLMPNNAPPNGSFVVTVNGVVSNNSTAFLLNNPVVYSIAPQNAAIGSEVTVSGQYFGSQTNASYITFQGKSAEIVSWHPTMIVCRVPEISLSQSTNVPVVVWLDANRYSSAISMNVMLPTINYINPSSDNIGALVTISGQSFGAQQFPVNGNVTFGGTPATIFSWSENSIQVRVPRVSTAGSHIVSVNINGRAATGGFNVVGPEVTSRYPQTASKGALLTLYGNHFGLDSDVVTRSVSIDTTGPVGGVTYSDNSISFTWPVDSVIFGTQNRVVTITIGGLITTYTVVAD